MPVVFVHGNPETDAIWDELVKELGRDDVVCLSPPGFGAPLPDGFGATSDEYVDWLAREIEAIPGPIDLVGHDWGGGHVMRLVCSRPDLVRSWVTDIGGCFDPAYVWHDMAQVWQTQGAGEEAVRQLTSAPVDQRTAQYQSLGMSPDAARRTAEAANDEMARAILALYRSAAQPAMSRWGEELPKAAARPGLVVIPVEDHYTGGEALARRSAERAGAKAAVLPGLGHWWMCQDPKRGAQVLREFFDSLPAQ
jgi:pimeloyl-ACP methyl ester carboxylesterase